MTQSNGQRNSHLASKTPIFTYLEKEGFKEKTSNLIKQSFFDNLEKSLLFPFS